MRRKTTLPDRTAIVAILILLATTNPTPILEAQAPVQPASQENVASVLGPDSRAEWTVTISTSGGFDGRGQGSYSITSAGGLSCFSTTPCNRQIQKPALQSLEGFINSATLPQALQLPGTLLPIPVQTSPSVCFDCIVTTMSLRIRDSKSIEWTYRWSWDVTTQANVPVDFIRIFQAASDLAR
jgi:hypothetical protein